MRVLLTGGSGFIGGYLIKRLLADGHAVRLIERYTPEKKQLLETFFGRDRISIIWKDISSRTTFASHCKGIDWVFHLAGQLNVFDINPLIFHTANTNATIHMLEASRCAGVSRFIYPASASCYGDAQTYPTKETAPVQLKYPYALTKYIGEQCTLHWGRVYKLPVVSLRVANVYGLPFYQPRHWGAMTSFVTQMRNGGPFQVRGNGKQSRDYIFVDDVVDALVRAASSTVAGESINIGTGVETTINDVLALLGGGDVQYLPRRHEEIFRMCVDNAKAAAMLGWHPNVSFEEGLRRVLRSSGEAHRIAIAH